MLITSYSPTTADAVQSELLKLEYSHSFPTDSSKPDWLFTCGQLPRSQHSKAHLAHQLRRITLLKSNNTYSYFLIRKYLHKNNDHIILRNYLIKSINILPFISLNHSMLHKIHLLKMWNTRMSWYPKHPSPRAGILNSHRLEHVSWSTWTPIASSRYPELPSPREGFLNSSHLEQILNSITSSRYPALLHLEQVSCSPLTSSKYSALPYFEQVSCTPSPRAGILHSPHLDSPFNSQT